MNRHLNIRFLGLLLILGLALGGGGFLLHYYQTHRNAGYLLSRGERAEADGDAATAIDYYGRYLVYRPQDTKARIRYGTLLAERAQTSRQKVQAYLVLERAIRDNPELTDSRRRLAELAMELGRFADAKTHLDQLLAEKKDNPELLELRGRCAEALGQLPEATANYEQAIKIGPQRIDSYIWLTGILLRTNQDKEADKLMNRLIQANPTSVRALLAHADYNTRLNRPELAGKDLELALAGPGRDDPEVWLAAGWHAYRMEQFKEARTLFERNLGKDVRFHIGLAKLEQRQGNLQRATEVLIKATKIEAIPQIHKFDLAHALIDSRLDQPAEHLIRQLRIAPNKLDERTVEYLSRVEYLEARLSITRNRYQDAIRQFENCRIGLKNYPGALVDIELRIAHCAERLGQSDRRIAACRRAVDIDRTSVDARRALADALFATNDIEEAAGLYRSLLDRSPDARFALATLLLRRELRLPPNQRDFTEVSKLIDGTPSDSLNSSRYYLSAVELELARARMQNARSLILRGLDRRPDDVLLWRLLAELSQNDAAAEALVLTKAEQKLGDRVDLRLARADLLVRQKGSATALRSLEAESGKFDDDDRDRLDLTLAEAYLQLNERADAERLLRQVAGRQKPGDPVVLFRLFNVIAPRNDRGALNELVEKLRATEGEDGTTWRYAAAYCHWLSFLADKGQNQQDLTLARSLLAEVHKSRPTWAPALVLQGEIEDKTGHIDAAIEKYLAAIRLGVREPVLIRRAMEILMGRRRFDEAQELLGGFRGTQLPSDLVRTAAVLSLARQESPRQAVELAKQAVKEDSKDPLDQIWLARIYWLADDKTKAEERFRQAVGLDRQSSAAWLSLIVFLARTDRTADAKAEIENARKTVPAAQLPQLLAAGFEAVGERAEAEKVYARMLQDAPGDITVARTVANFFLQGGELTKAEPLLRQMMNSPGVASEHRQWARRHLAIALMASRDYRKGTEAIALLDANLNEVPGSPDDLRARALLNASRPGSRKQSIKDLEASFVQRPTPNEQFSLARLYESDGDWVKARERYENLLNQQGVRNAGHVGYYVLRLIEHDDLTTATTWLSRLEDRGQKDPALRGLTTGLRARMLVKQDRRSDAIKLLEDYARKAVGNKTYPRELLEIGMLLADLKLLTEAEGFLRQYAKMAGEKDPSAVLPLINILADQNKVGEALQICSGLSSRLGPEVAARLAVAAIRRGNATPDNMTRAGSIITEAQHAKADSLDIQVSLADFEDAQGNYEQAKQRYQAILARDPRNALALNNLAWLKLFHEKDGEEALRLITTAIETVGPVADLLDTRGVILSALGRHREALNDLSESASMSPEPEPVTMFHLAQAHQRANQFVEARRAFATVKDRPGLRRKLHPLEQTSFIELEKQLAE